MQQNKSEGRYQDFLQGFSNQIELDIQTKRNQIKTSEKDPQKWKFKQ